MKIVIKYIGIVLVIAGIILVMKNLFTMDNDEFSSSDKKNKNMHYNLRISLLDKDTNDYLSGASLVLKNKDGEIIEKWVTKNEVHVIEKLKNGTYVLVQDNTIDGYHKNDKDVTFEISNKDKKITIYNKKMTQDEIEEARLKNTVANEIGVDNTLSEKSLWSILGGIASIGIGVSLIFLQRKSSSNDI